MFLLQGMNAIKARYLGENKVLISPENGSNLEEWFVNKEEWLGGFCESVEAWSPRNVTGNWWVWIRLFREPLHCWNQEVFTKILNNMGIVVSMDENTSSLERLEYARLWVKTSWSTNINTVRKVGINIRSHIQLENRGGMGKIVWR